MTKLKNKYVIGCHVMFYEIEIYKEYIDGLINLLETIDNKENVYLDLCFNVSEKIEKIDTDKITKEELIKLFKEGITRLKDINIPHIKWNIVHPKYIDHVFEDGPDSHLNPNQAKSRMSIEDMNKINSEVEEFDFTYINEPKIDGSCLVLSADLVKFGVNIPPCLIYNDDHGLSIMSGKLLGKNYIQFVCKNLLKVHARRHPKKRLYVLNEDNPYSLGKKINTFEEFRRLSDANIQTLTSNAPNKFYEYKDFKHE